MPKLYIIDGNAYIHRAYHSIPPLTTSKGEAVNAVYGFIRMILRIIKSEKPEYLAICFDYPAPNFRHKEYPAYKATRKEIDDALKNQMPLAREAAKALNITVFEKKGYEADDIIATLARNAEHDKAKVVIVTGDKDAYQLVNNNISIWNEQKKTLFDISKVEEKYGLKPDKLLDMFALIGDVSDNVPGVKGIGEKTAVKLIAKYGSIENIYENIDKIEGKVKNLLIDSKENAFKSKFLITLDEKVSLDEKWTDCSVKAFDNDQLLKFLHRMEFTSLIKELLPAGETKTNTENYTKAFSENIVDTKESLENLLSAIKVSKMVSVDLETTSLDTFQARIVGISMAYDKKSSFYIPVGHNYLNAPAQLPKNLVLEQLKPLLEDHRIKKYGHNLKYDLLVLKSHGINLEGVYFDTMVGSYCVNPSRQSHGLKNLVLDYLGYQMTEIAELIGKGAKQITMDKVEIKIAAPYACADAVMVLNLAEIIEKELKEKNLGKLFHELEMPLVEILSEMEYRGIKIDVAYLKQLSKEFTLILSELEKNIFKIAGEEFNLNSPKQLSQILFEKLKLPTVTKTKTGYSTNEEVLRILSSQHELPKHIMEYRELQKLNSTYVDALLGWVNEDTHRIHTSFNQTVAATGRLSSSDPNLQNIPVKTEYGRKIRKAFIAEKGCVLVSADYSQIDLRSLAHVSKDKALMQAFINNEDVHTTTAKEVFGKVDDSLRNIAKTINFGIVYGQSAYGLAQQLGISNTEAKQYIDSYFAKYSGVKQWMKDIVRETAEKGYVSTVLGRIRYIPEINSSNGQIRGFAERMALNTPIQGTSADIIKAAMINIEKELKINKYKTQMLLQVHDELIFEVPDNELDIIKARIKAVMENAVKLNVPLKVDLKIGQNWMDMRKSG